MHSIRLSRWPISAGGATTQPTRQPVIAWVLDRLLSTTVRAAMPSRLSMLRWLRS